jgi:hypothetical protein
MALLDILALLDATSSTRPASTGELSGMLPLLSDGPSRTSCLCFVIERDGVKLMTRSLRSVHRALWIVLAFALAPALGVALGGLAYRRVAVDRIGAVLPWPDGGDSGARTSRGLRVLPW